MPGAGKTLAVLEVLVPERRRSSAASSMRYGAGLEYIQLDHEASVRRNRSANSREAREGAQQWLRQGLPRDQSEERRTLLLHT